MCDRTDRHIHTTAGILAATEPRDPEHWARLYATLADHASRAGDVAALAHAALIAAERLDNALTVRDLSATLGGIQATDFASDLGDTLTLAPEPEPEKGGTERSEATPPAPDPPAQADTAPQPDDEPASRTLWSRLRETLRRL